MGIEAARINLRNPRHILVTKRLYGSLQAGAVCCAFCRWIHDYQDACVDKLENFVTGGETAGSSASRALTSSTGMFRPTMSKASSLTSPTPELHGPVCPLPVVSEGPQLMDSAGSLDSVGLVPSTSTETTRPASGQAARDNGACTKSGVGKFQCDAL